MAPVNPADLPLVTLDNNALIAIREDEPAAGAVNELLAMNRDGRIVMNVTLSTALEAARPGGDRLAWAEHVAWLESLGIAKANIFTGPRTIAFSDPAQPGVMLFDIELEIEFNARVHYILFPNISFDWRIYRDTECAKTDVPVEAMAEYDWSLSRFYIPPTPQHPMRPPTPTYDLLSPEQQARLRELHARLHRTWHNAKNDALGLYNHLTTAANTTHPEWSVFVTSDSNFFKQSKRAKMRALGF